MNDSSSSSTSKYTQEYISIRKLRKKLRQIETLERSDRALQEVELEKVIKKSQIRNELNILVEAYEQDTSRTMATSVENLEDERDESVACSNDSTCGQDEDVVTTTQHDSGDVETTTQQDSSDVETTTQQDSSDVETTTQQDSSDVETTTGHDLGDVATTRSLEYHKKATSSVDSDAVSANTETTRPLKELCHVRAQDSSDATTSPAKRKTLNRTEPIVQKNPEPRETADTTKKPRLSSSDNLKLLRKRWSQAKITITYLEGHHDLVTCVVVDGDHIISASRDTTVKVYNMVTCQLLFNLGGHTNTVTALYVLSVQQSHPLTAGSNTDQCIVSGSLDCSLRVWSLTTGRQLKEIYTFDPITSITYKDVNGVVVTGSEGGKIAMWDMCSGDKIMQNTPYTDRITALEYRDGHLYSCCADGEVRVHQVKGRELACVFVSENTRSQSSGAPIHLSRIHTLALHDGLLFIGDDGANVKILDWRTGCVRKLSNNVGEFGATDAVCFDKDSGLMLSSAYDIDHSLGYINLRSEKGGDYITTLSSPDVGRITCLACCHRNAHSTFVVSGGEELIVWKCGAHKHDSGSGEQEEVIHPKYLAALAREAVDSDADSDYSESDGDSDEVMRDSQRQLLSLDAEDGEKARSWCDIM